MNMRLHSEIYSEASVKAAVEAFEEYSTVKMSQDSSYWVVTVEDEDPDRAQLIARELGNMALGLSIDAGGSAR